MINSRTAGGRVVVSAATVFLALSAAVAVAAPADAATGDVNCPSSACVRVAAGLGSFAYAAPDNAGAVYLTYGTGELRKVELATGAVSTVATGLGNLRGVAIAAGSAYVGSFDGTLQEVSLATGGHRTLAAGLPALFGVTRHGNTTYATDSQGGIVAVPDGGSAHVVATGIGFSEGIAFDAAGAAYTADMETGNILRTDIATGATSVLATEDYEPTSISVGRDGLVYFQVGSEVLRLNPTTVVQSHVTNIDGINSFEFSLASSGSAYSDDNNGNLWQINNLIAR